MAYLAESHSASGRWQGLREQKTDTGKPGVAREACLMCLQKERCPVTPGATEAQQHLPNTQQERAELSQPPQNDWEKDGLNEPSKRERPPSARDSKGGGESEIRHASPSPISHVQKPSMRNNPLERWGSLCWMPSGHPFGHAGRAQPKTQQILAAIRWVLCPWPCPEQAGLLLPTQGEMKTGAPVLFHT